MTSVAPTAQTKADSSDFWDWLSPMVVKELRQGLRSRAFVGAFLALQLFFVCAIAIDLSIADVISSAQVSRALFWVSAGLILLVMIPINALGSVRSEMDENTLDLVLLTRVGAWKIVFGKWLANVTLVGLLALTTLPFMTLRHFLGGVEITQDLMTLGIMVIWSAVLSAIATAISPYCSRARRAVVIVLALFVIPNLLRILFLDLDDIWFGFRLASGGPLSIPSSLPRWFVFTLIFADPILVTVLAVLIGFHFGAKRIAPASENHDCMIRIYLWVFALCTLLSLWQDELYTARFVFTALVMLPFVACAPLQSIPSAAGAFRLSARRSVRGDISRVLLTPGWPSATLWAIATLALMGGLFGLCKQPMDFEAITVSVAALAALFAPSLFVRLLPLKKNHFPVLLGLHAVMAVVAIPISLLVAAHKADYTAITMFLPTTHAICLINNSIGSYELPMHFTAAAITFGASVVVLLILAWRGLGKWIHPLSDKAARPGGPDPLLPRP